MLSYWMSEKVQTSQLKPNKCACQMGVSTSSSRKKGGEKTPQNKQTNQPTTMGDQLVSSFSSVLSKKPPFSPQTEHCILKGVIDSSAGCKDPFFSPKDAHKAFLLAHILTHLSQPF